MNRKLASVLLAMGFVLTAGAQLRAETWDANAQFNATGVQSSADVWQYLYKDGIGGTNGGFTAMPIYTEAPSGPPYPYFAWIRDAGWGASLLQVPTQSSHLRADFGGANTSVLAWQSPVAGYVDLYVDVFKELAGGDGAGYWLFRDNDVAPLVSGTFAGDQTTAGIDAHTLTNVPVSVGTMLYLQVGAHTASFSSDTLSVDFTVSTSVPEPGTIALLGCGLVGLLAYAWRKRK